jgi:hypothetical protein
MTSAPVVEAGETEKKKKPLVRRHSSGDHAFLPNRSALVTRPCPASSSARERTPSLRSPDIGQLSVRKQEKAGKVAAQKNFGVHKEQIQDSEGTLLPTTRGY